MFYLLEQCLINFTLTVASMHAVNYIIALLSSARVRRELPI